MRSKLYLGVFALLILSLSCRKIIQETRIILHVVDDENGKPVEGAKILIFGVSNEFMNNILHTEVFSTDKDGKIDVTISSYQDKHYFKSGWSIMVFTDDEKYAHTFTHAKPETRNNKSVRLTQSASIHLHYHPIQFSSKLDSLSWGVNDPRDFMVWEIFNEYIKYWNSRNLKNSSQIKFSNCDTTIRIICAPLTTESFYYKTPLGVIHENCSLEKGEVKNVDIFY